MELIDGKKISSQIKEEIAQEVEKIKENEGKIPHLTAIIVGHDGVARAFDHALNIVLPGNLGELSQGFQLA
ncbi:MAG TPA: hypothetical protein VK982_15105, partial [Bacteroidales bacterium]|nr:hypothetical protein [Bacteroidales bacterium]